MNILTHLEEQEKKEQETLANMQILRLKEWAKEINFHKRRQAVLIEQTNSLLDQLGLDDGEKKKVIDKINSQEDVMEPKVSDEEKSQILSRIKQTIEFDKSRIRRQNGYRVGGFTFWF